MKRKMFWLMVVILALVISACGGGPGEESEQTATVNADAAETPVEEEGSAAEAGEDTADVEAEKEMALASQLVVYNWDDYIDEELLEIYSDEFGVEIIYDTFASNEDLLAKLQAGATGYDVIFPSDYMVSQMIELGLLAEIDVNDLENWGNIADSMKDGPFDPGNQHCVPYQWGTTGIGYRAGDPFFEENTPDSWAYLFDPELLEQYSDGGINVLNDQRELIGAALAYLGYSVNDTDRAHLEEARDIILEAKPYWKTFNSEDYDDTLLVPDEVVLSMGWSGDVASAYYNTYDDELEDGNWYYSIPEEGGVKWVDNICIPAASERYETALHFIDFLLEAENGAAITNYTYYASPNEAAREFIDPEVLEDESIYPPDSVFGKLEWLSEVGDAVFIFDEMWTAIKG
ncbi:MAG TPA: spermidine/putrescine ABC transporter substrate-binding protein [Patescibacteria group bacterium]|nr:spermidine/putrescine ABC transporter substrate-binding protein [Patescibacteria group bacterium]